MGTESELALQVLKQFRVIYGSAKRQFRDVEQSTGVSSSQLWVMHKIAETPGIGVSDLANQISLHQSTCSLLLNKLQTRGLVVKVRATDDQRRVGLALTDDGQQLLKRIPGPAEGVLPSALKNLSADELTALQKHLEALIAQFHVLDEQAAFKHMSEL